MSEYFPSTAADATDRFTATCTRAGASIVEFVHPRSAPDGSLMQTTCALLGSPEASSVVVVISGTHGVEGYLGSAIQCALADVYRRVPEAALLLVHGINPYGFAWSRRGNEDNVDVNRNFIDFEATLPSNDGYAGISRALCPPNWDDPDRAAADKALAVWIQQVGLLEAQAIISGGQYTHKDGLFYGGAAPSWSNVTYNSVTARFGICPRKAVIVDIHTGLGDWGGCEVIQTAGKYSDAQFLFGSVASLRGSVSSEISGALSTERRPFDMAELFCGTVMEFGTRPAMEVLSALREEACLSRGLDSAELSVARQKLVEIFAPDDRRWRETNTQRGVQMLRTAVDKLADL